MRIYGIDFTSRPTRSKPITCMCCHLEGTTLHVGELQEWTSFTEFEHALTQPGPWIAGIDFPFGQSRTFIENTGWTQSWGGYVAHVASMDRQQFKQALVNYKAPRRDGDKEHRRATDIKAGSISPQKIYGIPVGLMFFEGAPRLLKSGVTIPKILKGDPQRIVVEAYPGILARTLIGRRSYKQDTKSKQTSDQLKARHEILHKITTGALQQSHGLSVIAPSELANDPGADHLDALLCATQAAWAWTNKDTNFGAPTNLDALEGWIADPAC
tara:strand:- start:1299 stop:2108 length:810 start_codon:yes stop_codon:yes gene_type:complete